MSIICGTNTKTTAGQNGIENQFENEMCCEQTPAQHIYEYLFAHQIWNAIKSNADSIKVTLSDSLDWQWSHTSFDYTAPNPTRMIVGN